MKLSDLRIFITIIEAGSLSRAAQIRGTSQPNLSRILRDIEEQIGTPLLIRTGRGVELTPSGQVFRAFATQTLASYRAVLDEAARLGEGLPEQITVALPMRTEHILLPALLRTFATSLPQVKLIAREAFSEAAQQELAARKVDAMIGYLPSLPESDSAVVGHEAFYAIGDPKYLGETTDLIAMREVIELPLIVAGPKRFLDHITRAAHDCGGTLSPVRHCSAADAMVAFACEGEGVAVLPYSNFRREALRGEVCYRRIIEPAIERAIYVNLRPGLNGAVHRKLKDTILAALNSIREETRWLSFSRG